MTTPTAALVEEAETMAVRALDGTASREEKSALFAILAAALRRTEAELDAATTQLAKKFKRLEELERRCTQAESERNELRATVTRLNRRAQTAEAGVRDNVEASKAAGKSMGRTLANAAAAMYRRRAEQAEAERDAQHAEVLRLTGERDAARAGWQQEVIKGIARAQTVCDVVDALDEARSLGFGLGCMLTNSREETEWQVEETRTLRREVRELSERLAGMPMPEDDDPAGKHLMSLINRRRELYQRVDELTSTRDLLTEENARLQKERDATLAMETDTARRSSAEIDSLKVELNEAQSETEDLNRRVAELLAQRNEARQEADRRLDMVGDLMRLAWQLRAHIATLELLRRGGK